MRLPYWLLRLLPVWEYICPKCRREVPKNSHGCPHCGERFPLALRVPPSFLKDPKKLEEYVHKHVFPRVSAFERAYLTKYFTTIFSDGFESGDFSAWTGTVESGGTNSVISLDQHHDTYSFQSTLSSNADLYIYKTIARARVQHNLRVYCKLVTTPNANCFWLSIRDASGSQNVGYLGVTPDRYIYLRYTTTGGTYYDTSATQFPNDAAWHCFELEYIPSATVGSYKAYLDGDEIADITQTGLNANYYVDTARTGARCPGGSSTTTGSVKVDCVVVADAYIGPEAAGGTAYYETITESLGLTETIPSKANFKKGISDLLGLTDTTSKRASFKQGISDLLGMLDSAARGSVFKQTISEILGLTDSVARKGSFKQIISDLLGLKDSTAFPSVAVPIIGNYVPPKRAFRVTLRRPRANAHKIVGKPQKREVE